MENQEKWLKNKREALMITAGVIAAMASQAGLNPPGGIWQDDKSGHVAGTSIMGDYYPAGYREFWIYNTVAFVTSVSTNFLLISNGDRVGHNNMHGARLLDFTVGRFTTS